MSSRDFDPARMLGALHAAGVRFVLIGGMAAILHGDAGVTLDLDLVPDRETDNLEKLARALRSLGARIRATDAPEGLDFDCSAAFFRNLPADAIVNLTTDAGDLDLAFRPSGTEGYSDLRRDAALVEVADGVEIQVASLGDVIRSKAAADREKDRQALPRLRQLLARVSKR